MAKSPFARLEVERVDLGDDLWVEVKRDLSYGDTRRMAADPEPDVAMLLAVIVDWNFPDQDGRTVEISRDAIQALNVRMTRRLLDICRARLEAVRDEAMADDSEKKEHS